MSKKKETTTTLLSPEEHTQVEHLIAQYHQLIQDLRTITTSEEAERALTDLRAQSETVQIAFVAELGKQQEEDAADLLVALNAFSDSKEVRKEARRSLIRLESARIRPQWHPPVTHTPAIQVHIENAPRFWKGYVTQSREQGEMQLTLVWEQGYDYSDARMIGFLLDFWNDGVKDVLLETGSKRHIQEHLDKMRNDTRKRDIPLAECTAAEGKRLLEEALSVNEWRQTRPHADYRNVLPVLKSLLLESTDLGEDRGKLFLHPDLTDEETALNFIGAWSMGDYGLCYDLLSERSNIREDLSRSEWIQRRRAWASESHPTRMELGFVHQQEQNQSTSLWLPSSAGRSSTRKEVAIGWSLELQETPLSGTLKEMPLGTIVNKETRRHWFWTSYTLARSGEHWQIQQISDEGVRAQGLPINELQQKAKEFEEAVENMLQQAQSSTFAPTQELISDLYWRITVLLHYYDALIVRLPLDKKVYEDAYRYSVVAGTLERGIAYIERMEERFPDPSGETLRTIAATISSFAYSERLTYLPNLREHLLTRAEEILRESLQRNNDASGHLLLGELLISQFRNDEAEVELQQAREFKPAAALEASIESGLGTIEMRREQMSEAIPHFQRVSEIASDYPGNWFALGFAHRLLGNFKEAEDAYKRAIRVDSSDIRPFMELTALYMQQGDSQAARLINEQGVRANPESAQLHALLASVLLETGDIRTAKQELEQAERLDSSLEIVQQVRQAFDRVSKR